MNELKRHRLVYKYVVPPLSLFLKWKFNYQYDSLRDIEGPYLLLPNHNLELDPAFIGVAARHQLYFVASEHITRKGIASRALNYFFKPIIHMKGRQGSNTVKQMLKMLKEGHSICIFPEGNRSFNGLTGDMLPAIGKVARRSGAKLITYRVEGGYLSQPRWGCTLRKGKMKGRLIHVYSNEELHSMTDDQINRAICDDLYEDAYATQEKEMVAFKGKNLALGLESTIFTCPDCGRISTLRSEDDRVFCDCGFHAIYDVYGYLTDGKGRKYTVTELDTMQREALTELIKNSGDEPLFSDEVTRYEISGEHKLTCTKKGILTAYRDRFECCGQVIPFADMTGMAIYSRNCLIMHIKGNDGHVELKSDLSFSALKYLYLYNTKGKEQ